LSTSLQLSASVLVGLQTVGGPTWIVEAWWRAA